MELRLSCTNPSILAHQLIASGAETRMFQENQFTIMATDALAPSITRASEVKIFTMQRERVTASCEVKKWLKKVFDIWCFLKTVEMDIKTLSSFLPLNILCTVWSWSLPICLQGPPHLPCGVLQGSWLAPMLVKHLVGFADTGLDSQEKHKLLHRPKLVAVALSVSSEYRLGSTQICFRFCVSIQHGLIWLVGISTILQNQQSLAHCFWQSSNCMACGLCKGLWHNLAETWFMALHQCNQTPPHNIPVSYLKIVLHDHPSYFR